jgi:hypothetical protein
MELVLASIFAVHNLCMRQRASAIRTTLAVFYWHNEEAKFGHRWQLADVHKK